MMASKKRKHVNKVLNENIFNELVNDSGPQEEQLKIDFSDSSGENELHSKINKTDDSIYSVNSRLVSPDEKRKDNETESDAVIPVLTMNKVVEEYHKALYNQAEAIGYLEKQGIKNIQNFSAYKIGFCDGNLINRLGSKQIEEFKKLKIIDDNGLEVLRNCIVFPVFNTDNELSCIYGVNITSGNPVKPVYLTDKIPIYNEKASKIYDEVILTDDILKCLVLIELGFNNVIAVNDLNNITAGHLEILHDARVKTIVIAIEDEKTADSIKDVFVIDDFKVKIIKVERNKLSKEGGLGKTGHIFEGVRKEELKKNIDESFIFKHESMENGQRIKVFKEVYGYLFVIGEITYRVTGVKDVFYSGSLKVSIRAGLRQAQSDEYDWFPDTVDLYTSRSRETFSGKLSSRFGLEAKRIEKDLLLILDYLEEEQLKKFSKKEDEEKIYLTEEERELGMEFLKSPDIFKSIINDIEELGFVGEDNNKLLMYLCAVSRKLDDPISVIIISQSGAGKSHLVNTVKRLVPEEDLKNANSASELAFYYSDDLLGKFIIMGEAVHSEKIEHQIREMISEKELVRYVVLKDEKTGEMKSVEKRVKVNASLVITTTRNDINDENLSRCFIIHTDESVKQTKRILEFQKERFSLESYYRKKEKIPQIILKHHAAQRLLTNRVIVNPFRKHLAFLEENMRRRRDFYRFQVLIASCAFLRQMQKTEYEDEKGLKYIKCDLTDYITAYNLGKEIFTTNLEGIPNGAILLYEEIRLMVHETAKTNSLKPLEITFTQRDLRKRVKMGADSVRKYISVLVRYEYLAVTSGKAKGTRYSYRLVVDEAMEKVDFSKVPTPEMIKEMMEDDNNES